MGFPTLSPKNQMMNETLAFSELPEMPLLLYLYNNSII